MSRSYSALGSKAAAAAADARSYIFDIQLWFVFAAGSSYSPALPFLVEFWSSAAMFCPSYLYLVTAL